MNWLTRPADTAFNVVTGKGVIQNLLKNPLGGFFKPKSLAYNAAMFGLPITGAATSGRDIDPSEAPPNMFEGSMGGLKPLGNIARLFAGQGINDRFSDPFTFAWRNAKDLYNTGSAAVSAPFSPIRRMQLGHGIEAGSAALASTIDSLPRIAGYKDTLFGLPEDYKKGLGLRMNEMRQEQLGLSQQTLTDPNASGREQQRAQAIVGRSPEALAQMAKEKGQQAAQTAQPAIDIAKATPEQIQQHFPQMQENFNKLLQNKSAVEELKNWNGRTPLSPEAQALQQHGQRMGDAVNKMGFEQYRQLTGGKGTPQEFVNALNGANPNDPAYKAMISNVDKELARSGQPPQARQAVLNHILDMPTPAKVAIVMGLGLGIASMIGGDFMAGAALLGAGVLGGQMLGGNLGALAGKATGRPQAPGVPMPGSLTQDQMGKDKTYQLLAQGQHGTIPPDQIVQHLARLRPEALDAILQQNPALKPFAAQAAQLRTQGQAYVASRQNAQALGRQAAQQQAQSLRQTAAKVGLPADPAGFQQFMAANRNNPQALTDAVAKLRAADPQAPAQMAQMIRQGLRDNYALNPDGSIRKAYMLDPRVRDAQAALNALGG